MCQLRLSLLLVAGWTLLACFPTPTRAIVPVSIATMIPTTEHVCVTRCLYYFWWGNYYGVGEPLSCGVPYDNDCWCATNSASASKARSYITSCASTFCAAGDFSNDLTSIHSVYASYCMNAGYTQPGATDWYTMGGPKSSTTSPTTSPATSPTTSPTTSPMPQQTPSSGATQTTTQLVVVTQTVPASPASLGTQSSQPQSKWLLLLLLAWPLAIGVSLVL